MFTTKTCAITTTTAIHSARTNKNKEGLIEGISDKKKTRNKLRKRNLNKQNCR